MSKSIQIQREELSTQIVNKLLWELDSQFAERISQSVIIEDYAKKLSENASFISAKYDDNYIGVCAFYINDVNREYYIPYVCISTSYRNMGIASKMFDEICKNADSNKFDISLEVRNDNVNAMNLYRKYGFIEVCTSESKTFMTRKYRSQ